MNITILGCGEYGSALASVFLEKNFNKVTVWNKFEDEILKYREKYLTVNFTTNLESATINADLIVVAIPVAFLDDTIFSLKDYYKGQDILIASKGIDTKSYKFAYEIIQKHLGNVEFGVISGGTFARDMKDKKVMGITLGTTSFRIKEKVKSSLETNYLKVQYTNDYIGVSVCGAIKNVMAIGFGMLDGAEFPPSSKFLFLTEAIYEIQALIKSLSGNPNTVYSYAGIDDIMMTCTSIESRNYTLGNMIGRGLNTKEIDEYKNKTTVEGLGTALAFYHLIKDNNLNAPISKLIYEILYEGSNIMELINLLEKRES